MAHAEAQPAETTVGLEQLLAAKEQRAARQSAALARFRAPVVSISIVTPGAAKDGWLPRRVMEIALRELSALYMAKNWPVTWHQVFWEKTGPEAIHVIDADAQVLKLATIELEDRHPIGRLWDLDVIAPGERLLSRKQLSFPPRRCLVCERPAHECGRSRRHPLRELLKTIERMVNDIDLY
jgi:holo-ACP synthase